LNEIAAIKKLDTVSDMLKPQGSIYIERQVEMDRQKGQTSQNQRFQQQEGNSSSSREGRNQETME